MKSNVLNANIDEPDGMHFFYPSITEEQNRKHIAELFEQLLIFDKVTLTTNRLGYALFFLIRNLGINDTERLLRAEYVNFILWTPVIVTGAGTQLEDGKVDESTIYGQPPLAAGSLSPQDIDPERQVDHVLKHFRLHKDRKKDFKKLALKQYIIPNGMEFSVDSAKLVIDAYKNDNLKELGLPFVKEPNMLNSEERFRLLTLGAKVIQTAVLSKYQMKSLENNTSYSICKQNFNNIGKAYNVLDNASTLFNLEQLPNLKKLYLDENLMFDQVFKIRHTGNAKYYRKWINEVGEDANAEEITKEYLNEIRGSTSFFESSGGKFVKVLGLFAVNKILTEQLIGVESSAVDLTLGMLESYWLDNLLKGKNPSLFINDIRKEIN